MEKKDITVARIGNQLVSLHREGSKYYWKEDKYGLILASRSTEEEARKNLMDFRHFCSLPVKNEDQ